MTGTILRILHLRGYGFIYDEAGDERFFHARDLVDQRLWPRLEEGQAVEFEAATRPRGARNQLGVTGVKPR
jgi:cold shock CspA family protein